MSVPAERLAGRLAAASEKTADHHDSITAQPPAGHSPGMEARQQPTARTLGETAFAEVVTANLTLTEVYEAHFDFVWRSARRLGVSPLYLDDVVQEVFLVVHRRLHEFEGRGTLKSWLFGIARRLARDHRRTLQRKPTQPLGLLEPSDPHARPADEQLALREQGRLLYATLAELDDDKREAFVLAELEQLSGPEIAAALQINLNTVYARVRAARLAFEAALDRQSAREQRGAR